MRQKAGEEPGNEATATCRESCTISTFFAGRSPALEPRNKRVSLVCQHSAGLLYSPNPMQGPGPARPLGSLHQKDEDACGQKPCWPVVSERRPVSRAPSNILTTFNFNCAVCPTTLVNHRYSLVKQVFCPVNFDICHVL